jgi:uncharacterized protein (TIGR00255 family)
MEFAALPPHDAQESMTGFAVIEKQIGSKLYRLNMKSINNRYFEMKWRAPKEWFSLEIPLKAKVQSTFSRGSFDFVVEEIPDGAKKDEKHHVQSFMLQLQEAMKSVKGVSSWTMPSFVRAMILARHPEFWMPKNGEHKISLEEALPAMDELLSSLQKIRRDEGHRVASHISQCLSSIAHEWKSVSEELPRLQVELEEQYKKKMDEAFQRFSIENVEQQRLASEIALLMEKRDCSEEMERIKMHVEALRDALEEGQSNLGKRVDFMAQELLREWTTLGSKVRHHKVFHHVLNAKLEIEKIREQSLNLA